MAWILRITTERPWDASIRAWRTISKAGFMEIGLLWESQYKKMHFGPQARSRYAYRPRKAKYQKRKEYLASRHVPKISPYAAWDLVYTGASRRAIEMNHVPRAYPTRVTIDMATPSYFQMRPKSADRPNLGEEMARITGSELGVLERHYQDTVEAGMEKYRARKTTTIK